jgi:hypothetical protein
MENPENYITRKEALTYFQNHKTIHVIFKKNKIEEVYINNRYWYNKKQIEDLSNELNYRLSIRTLIMSINCVISKIMFTC